MSRDESEFEIDPEAAEAVADPGSDAAPEPDSAHDRAREGIEHLQAAARELIAAARAALDVAEDMVDDPDTVASLTGVAETVTGFVRSVVPSRRQGGDAARGGREGDDDEGDSTVQRIPVT